MNDVALLESIKWYDPNHWPHWVRWGALIPLSTVAGIIVYFIYTILNGLAWFIPSSITSLIAVGIGFYEYVRIGRIVAPAFSRLVGFTLAATALVLVGWFLGNVIVQAPNGMPQWYTILVGLIGIGATIGGISADVETKNSNNCEMYARLPTLLRWLLFLPISIALMLASCIAFAIPLAFMLNPDALRLASDPISVATFIGVSAAVVPRGKNFVGIAFAVLIGIFAAGQLFAGLDRGEADHIFASFLHNGAYEIVWGMSPWYQTLTGLGMMAGCIIGATGAIQAEESRKQVQSV